MLKYDLGDLFNGISTPCDICKGLDIFRQVPEEELLNEKQAKIICKKKLGNNLIF